MGPSPWRHASLQRNEKESVVKKYILAALVLAVSGPVALADVPTEPVEYSLSGKAMRDLPGNNGGGRTSIPTAIPDDFSLSGKAMRDQLGNTRRGATSMPTAKPSEYSLSGKAMNDLPGNN
jgi:hypothetical protein